MKFKKYFSTLSFLFISFAIFSQSYEWGGRFGGTGEDVVRKMHVDANGNSYLTGYFTDTSDFDISSTEFNLTSNGMFDAFVLKTDTEGNLLWAISVGGVYYDYGTGITTDDQGNVYITGYFDGIVDFDPSPQEWFLTSQGGGDVFILKINSNGDFMWAKSIGGLGYEESTSIGVDELGNVYVLGYLYETVDFDPGIGEVLLTSLGGSDVFLLELDSAGDFVKVYTYGGVSLDLALDMSVKSSTEIFLSGFFNGTTDLDPRPDEEYILTSLENSTGYTMQIDETGAIVNVANTEGGNTEVYAIAVDSDNNMYVTGNFSGTVNFDPSSGNSENTFTSNIAANGFVLKVLVDGSVEWARHITSDDVCLTYDIVVGSDGNVHTTGFFLGTVDFDPSPLEFILTKHSGNALDAYLLSLDTNGAFINAYQFGGIDFIDSHQLGIDNENNIYLAAHFETTVDINPSPVDTEEVTALGFRDNYLIKMGGTVLSTPSFLSKSLEFYPNPAKRQLILKGDANLSGENYSIYNLLGQEVANGILTETQTVEIEGLISGHYMFVLSNNRSFKFIKH